MYHHLLHQQIQAHLPQGTAGNPQLEAFLASVDGVYHALEECEERVEHITVAELKRNNNLFRTLLTNMHSGIAIEDENRKVIFVNRRFCEMMSMDVTPEQAIGADASDYANLKKRMFADPVEYIRKMEETLSRRQPVNEQQLEMADGTVLEWNYLPINMDGADRGHLWEFKDVTSQVRAQERLEESNERNRMVMSASMDAIIVADDDRAIRYWNPRAVELFGWLPEEVMGKRMDELLHPRKVSDAISHDRIQYPDRDLSPILNQVLELTAVNKSGEEFMVELIVVPYQQRGKNYYCKFVKDISHRKKQEELLRQQEMKYHRIIANINLGMLEVGLDDKLHSPNQAFLTMSGYDEEEIVGQTFHKPMPSQEELARINDKLDKRRKGSGDTYEVPILHKSGEMRWWLVSGGPNINDSKEMIGTIAVVLDITDQKRLEKELGMASKAKEAFLANMSHEIRTPLNAIIGMIRELGRESLSPQQQGYLSHTDTAARHLLSIVNSILDISKIEAGELELENHDFSLEALVDNIESILHVKAAQRQLEFRCDLDPDLWPAYRGDSARIRQILLNLLDNAIKFTPHGSVRLHVKVKEEREDVQTVRLTIIDTGIGMDAAYLDQLFAKFSQAEKSISRRFGGTGLGMSITKEILKLMGGTISVTSEEGRGTKFVIDVDLARGDLEGIAGPSPTNQDQLRGAHLLLVEDNVMNRFIARKSLAHFGCTVDEVENGRVALERLRERPYDLILMDIQMPELDGIETTKVIRNELNLTLPIVALTANAFKQDIDGYLAIGMNDYVTKPFEENRLFEVIVGQLADRPEPQLPPVDDSYDLTQLRELSHGDRSFIEQMVGLFVAHTPEGLREIEQALAAGDYPALARAAHRLKPSIQSMGIHQMDGVAKEIELGAKAPSVNVQVLTTRVHLLTRTLDRVMEKLQREHA